MEITTVTYLYPPRPQHRLGLKTGERQAGPLLLPRQLRNCSWKFDFLLDWTVEDVG